MATNDPEFYQAPKYTPEAAQPPRQRGCFFYGCIIASILMVLVLILIGLGVYFGYRFVSQLVEEYTASAPRDLPKVEMPAEERKALKSRVEEFRKAVDEGKGAEPLILTSEDLNALIEEEPELKGKVYLKIEGDELKGQVSIPLEKIGWSMLRGRYLNGEADLKASLNNGVLIVTLDSLEVNGKRPPPEFMTKLKEQNLAKDAYNNPKNAEMLRKVESLEIKDGKVIIRVRAKPAEATGKEAEKRLPSSVLSPDSQKKDAAQPDQKSPSKPASEPAASPLPKR
jgi:hypothetical protein